jgi:hypothetical protein
MLSEDLQNSLVQREDTHNILPAGVRRRPASAQQLTNLQVAEQRALACLANVSALY